jgi:hypothetical protein
VPSRSLFGDLEGAPRAHDHVALQPLALGPVRDRDQSLLDIAKGRNVLR